MKKVSLLVTTMGGALAGYLLSNKQLRDEVSKAKDAEAAAKLIGKHLQKDSKKFAGDVKKLYNEPEVQENITQAKKYAKDQMNRAKKELSSLSKTGAKKAGKTAKAGAKKASASAKRATKTAKKSARKTTKRGRK